MKRLKLFFVAVLACLLLCACGNKKQISGRVLAFKNGILTVQTEKGKTSRLPTRQPVRVWYF